MDMAGCETFTADEVSRMFGIHRNSVYRAAKNGDLRTVRAPVRRVLFPRREILKASRNPMPPGRAVWRASRSRACGCSSMADWSCRIWMRSR